MAVLLKISVIYIMGFFNYLSNNSATMYYILVTFFYLAYILAFLGIYYVEPKYTEYLSIVIRLFVAIVLLIRFNPYFKVRFNENDKILISAAAFFLLVNTGVTEVLFYYFDKISPFRIPLHYPCNYSL